MRRKSFAIVAMLVIAAALMSLVIHLVVSMWPLQRMITLRIAVLRKIYIEEEKEEDDSTRSIDEDDNEKDSEDNIRSQDEENGDNNWDRTG